MPNIGIQLTWRTRVSRDSGDLFARVLVLYDFRMKQRMPPYHITDPEIHDGHFYLTSVGILLVGPLLYSTLNTNILFIPQVKIKAKLLIQYVQLIFPFHLFWIGPFPYNKESPVSCTKNKNTNSYYFVNGMSLLPTIKVMGFTYKVYVLFGLIPYWF